MANWALSFCASRPFWSLNPPAAAAVDEVGAGTDEEGADDEEEALVAGLGRDCGEAPAPPTPGFCVKSTSCVPSAMGPPGLAGQEPGGFRGAVLPKGMVPG